MLLLVPFMVQLVAALLALLCNVARKFRCRLIRGGTFTEDNMFCSIITFFILMISASSFALTANIAYQVLKLRESLNYRRPPGSE